MGRKIKQSELAKLYPRIKCFSMTEKPDPIATRSISLSIVDIDTILAILKEVKTAKDEAWEKADEDSRRHLELQSVTANDLYEKIYAQKKKIFEGGF